MVLALLRTIAVATSLALLPAPGFALPVSGLPEVDLSTLPDSVRAKILESIGKVRAEPASADATGELGMRYFANGFQPAGADCFARASALDAKSFRWAYYHALAREKLSEIDAAIAAFEQAIAIDPAYAPALVRLANLVVESDPARGRSLFARAVAANPLEAAAHLGLGKCARLEGRVDEAIREFRRAIEILPHLAEAHYALAMALGAAGDRDGMRSELALHASGSEPPLSVDPLRAELLQSGDSSSDLRRDARELAKRGQLEEAEAVLRRALELDASSASSHKELGLVFAQQGAYEEAIGEFNAALAADPANFEAKASLGLALAQLGRNDEAEQVFKEVLAAHPELSAVHVYYGQFLARTGRGSEALEHLRRGVKGQPANGLYQFALGDFLARASSPDSPKGREDTAEAIDHLRRAVTLLPQHAAAHYTLGVLLARTGDLMGSKRELDAAIELSPRMADAWIARAGVSLIEKDAQSAVRFAERGCEISNDSVAGYLTTLADAYLAANRPADAAKARERADAARQK